VLEIRQEEFSLQGGDTMKATMEQIKYATDLLRKLGYDVADYDFEKMTREEVSELIDELKDEYEG
jgi:hypothetical protein